MATAFYLGSGVRAVGGIAEIAFGFAAERRQLEDVAKPLTVADAEAGAAPPEGAQAPPAPAAPGPAGPAPSTFWRT